MGYSPLTLSKALRTPLGTALAALSVLVLLYSVVVTARILAGVLFLAVVAVGYLAFRLIAALEAVADGHQRLADAHEHSAYARPPRRTDDAGDGDSRGDGVRNDDASDANTET